MLKPIFLLSKFGPIKILPKRFEQIFVDFLQRVLNTHPEGGNIGDGASPTRLSLFLSFSLIGSGIGIGNIKTKNIVETTSAGTATGSNKTISDVLSYQGKIGASYLLNNSNDIFLEGVITRTEGFTYNTGKYDPATDIGVNLGFRHRF